MLLFFVKLIVVIYNTCDYVCTLWKSGTRHLSDFFTS